MKHPSLIQRALAGAGKLRNRIKRIKSDNTSATTLDDDDLSHDDDDESHDDDDVSLDDDDVSLDDDDESQDDDDVSLDDSDVSQDDDDVSQDVSSAHLSSDTTSKRDTRQCLTGSSTIVGCSSAPDVKPELTKQCSADRSGDDVSGNAAHARLRRDRSGDDVSGHAAHARPCRERSDDKINDSITNMTLMTNALYDLTCAASRYVWLFLRVSVAFIYNSIIAAVTSRDASASTDGGPSSDRGERKVSKPKSVKPSADINEEVRHIDEEVRHIYEDVRHIDEDVRHIYEDVRHIDKEVRHIDEDMRHIDEEVRHIDKDVRHIDKDVRHI